MTIPYVDGSTTLTAAEKAFHLLANLPLADSSVTVQPFTGNVSEYTLPASTLSANRNLTLGVNSAVTGKRVVVVRQDLTVNTYAIINGGTDGGTMFTFVASPPNAQAASFYYNGVDWVYEGWVDLLS